MDWLNDVPEIFEARKIDDAMKTHEHILEVSNNFDGVMNVHEEVEAAIQQNGEMVQGCVEVRRTSQVKKDPDDPVKVKQYKYRSRSGGCSG